MINQFQKLIICSLAIMLTVVISSSPALAVDASQEAKAYYSPFVWGYGARSLFIFLPYPYIECGFQSSQYSIKAAIGSVLWWGRGTLEISRKRTFSDKTDIFLNAGYEYVVMGYAAKTYGVGIDYDYDQSLNMYLRFELELYKFLFAESNPDKNSKTIDTVFPSFGIGYRF